jgi:hypothetical protein
MDIQEHQKTWNGFLTLTKIATVAIIAILIFMAFTLI